MNTKIITSMLYTKKNKTKQFLEALPKLKRCKSNRNRIYMQRADRKGYKMPVYWKTPLFEY